MALCLWVLTALAFTSCEQADDIDGIFSSHGWSFSGFCYTADWNSGRSAFLDIKLTGYEAYSQHAMTFLPGGKAEIRVPGCTFSADWEADGSERSFYIRNMKVVSGSEDHISAFSRKFCDDLKATVWYRGDSNFIRLYGDDCKYYLLFKPLDSGI